MAIPDFQTLMLPFLKLHEDEREHRLSEIVQDLSDEFKLSEDERNKLLQSGNEKIMRNRVRWARFHLLKAELLKSANRGTSYISEEGKKLLKQSPEKITMKFLEQHSDHYKEYKARIRLERDKRESNSEEIEDKTPNELVDENYELSQQMLAEELLEKLRQSNPYTFESMMAKLFTSMGYGKAFSTKRSGDGGIDGEVTQDKLGLETIFFQTKRYANENTVPISEVRDFIGALDGQRANKGVFITTSSFPREATKFLERVSKKVILIDGEKLTELMIEHNVGVVLESRYDIKKIDDNFFSEE